MIIHVQYLNILYMIIHVVPCKQFQRAKMTIGGDEYYCQAKVYGIVSMMD